MVFQSILLGASFILPNFIIIIIIRVQRANWKKRGKIVQERTTLACRSMINALVVDVVALSHLCATITGEQTRLDDDGSRTELKLLLLMLWMLMLF